MNLIKIIIAISSMSILFAKFNPFLIFAKNILKVKRLKPFECELCMAFWTSLIASFWIEGTENKLLLIGLTPILTYLTWRNIEKY